MPRIPSKACLLFLGIALLAGCNRHKEVTGTPGGGSPEDATRDSLELIHQGKFDLFWQHALPPADFAALKADWPKRNAAEEPINDDDRAKFANGVKRLTEPDAEKKLFVDLRPTLVRFDRDYKDQMPLISGMAQSMALTAIEQSKDLSIPQKRQLREAVNVIAPWTQTVAWGDQDKARRAVAIVVDSARNAHLSTPEAMHTMDFNQSMASYTAMWDGLKKLLDVYGLSLDKTFDSISIDTLENTGGTAHVKITYTILDKPIQTDATLVMLDGRWYDSDLLQSVRNQHVKLNPPPPASSAPAPAASNAAPPHDPVAPVAAAKTR
ncbi:hypothetical protein KPL74_15995 [Bacillus sp. NP157]|nr:hypothetical protein KPL74_15995 [Bacillus sp. NP157]